MTTPIIRPETPADYDSIAEVNLLAFGQEAEGHLIETLRQTSDFISELSLVAENKGRVIGHILFSPIHIETSSGNIPALALAPMAVLPDYQNQGIGSLLVREGLDACQRLGYTIVIVLGHPEFYPRFGFVPASTWGIESPFPSPDEAFMALELVPDALAGIHGMVRYPPAFDDV